MSKWEQHFQNAMDSEQTIECIQCGSCMIGDGAPRPIICTECFKHPGIILRDRVICMECACIELQGGTLVTTDTHPDGFTCSDCDTVYSSEKSEGGEL